MIQPTNRIADYFNPDGTVKPAGQATQPADVLSDLFKVLAARADVTGGNVNAESATSTDAGVRNAITTGLHNSISLHLPVSPKVFVQEFKAALKASPVSNFGGTGKYDSKQEKLLAQFSALVDAQKVLFDLNLTDDTSAPGVLQKLKEGLGVIPAEYRELVTESVVKALKDLPEARKVFGDLMRFAKASAAILDEAKKDNLSEPDTAMLINLLQQAQPLEGVLGALISNASDAAAQLDVGALVKIFDGYVKSLEGIVKPLVEKHMPTDLDKDPLKVAAQVQAPFENILTEYADKVGPVAQDVIGKLLAYLKGNAGPISTVVANGVAAFSAFANRIQRIFSPAPPTLLDIVSKVSSN